MVWSETPSLLLPALIIAMIGFTEAAAIARTYAVVEARLEPEPRVPRPGRCEHRELGSGGFPVGASFSRSALNRLAGAKTALSAAITGATVLGRSEYRIPLNKLQRTETSCDKLSERTRIRTSFNTKVTTENP